MSTITILKKKSRKFPSILRGKFINVNLAFYNSFSTCFDAYGTLRQEGEEWTGRDDPCLLYVCKPGGMVVSVNRRCPPPDATPPPGCQLHTRPGACCKILYCP